MKCQVIYLLAILCCLWSNANPAPLERIMVDMTYVFDENAHSHPLWRKFEMSVVMNGTHESGNWIQGEEIFTSTHMGTHMDAPSHFTFGGINIGEIPVSKLIVPAAVINIVQRAQENPDAEVTVEDLETWERTTGESLDGTVILVNSGWGQKWHSRSEYIGTDDEDATKLHFPGIAPEAAQWLVDNRHICGVGIDTISFDRGITVDYASHRILLGKGLYGLENVANVDKIPIYGATLHIMPMKIARASGSPTRIIATFPKVIYNH